MCCRFDILRYKFRPKTSSGKPSLQKPAFLISIQEYSKVITVKVIFIYLFDNIATIFVLIFSFTLKKNLCLISKRVILGYHWSIHNVVTSCIAKITFFFEIFPCTSSNLINIGKLKSNPLLPQVPQYGHHLLKRFLCCLVWLWYFMFCFSFICCYARQRQQIIFICQ